jgi:hypothetical protein
MSRVNPWRLYDRVYHFFGQVWRQIIVGIIVSTVAANFFFSGVDGIGDPRRWWFIRVLLDYGIYASITFPLIGLTAALAIYGHRTAHPYSPITSVTRLSVRRLDAVRDGLVLGLGSNAPKPILPGKGLRPP